jgi:siroheme synthase
MASFSGPEQTVISGTIADIAERLDNAPQGPALVMIGRALAEIRNDADADSGPARARTAQ